MLSTRLESADRLRISGRLRQVNRVPFDAQRLRVRFLAPQRIRRSTEDGQALDSRSGLWQEFQQAHIAVKRLADIMDAPTEPQSLTPARTTEGRGEIRIEGLAFRYSPAHPYVYENLDLTLAPGTLTLLTGPSGSGKSTLAKILLGFYAPEAGRVLLDGKDIGQLAVNELRSHFGVVPQETMLFSGTVYENLTAGNANAALQDVVSACQVAEIHTVIEHLPNGYQTTIGEHGVGLSGGQKQRIAIARALLQQPKILIFDEATASLDEETAERFAQTVNKLRGRVTMLFIAHHSPRGLQVDAGVRLGTAASGSTGGTR